MRRPIRGLLLLLALLAPACSTAGPATFAVTGSVALDGQPIPEGAITFRPLDGNVAPQSAPIKNGQFSLPLPAGPMRVEVSAARPSSAPPVAGMGPSMEDYIPSRYTGPNTTLQADIKPESGQKLEFALESEPANK